MDDQMDKIAKLQRENKIIRAKMRQQAKCKEKLMLEMKQNKQKMDNIFELEKKIEKYEFVLNIEKYKKVTSWLNIDELGNPSKKKKNVKNSTFGLPPPPMTENVKNFKKKKKLKKP